MNPACGLVLLGAVVLSACLPSASASPSPSSAIVSPSATATSFPTTTPTPSPTPTAAAKRTPTPVAAERPSDLVVRLEGAGDTGFPLPLAVLTSDGRFVTRTDDNQLLERRLTPAGVQRVRDELTATGLFERDQHFPLEIRPDATPPAHGIGSLYFKVWRDPRTVEVQTAMDQGAEEVYFQPSAARTRLDRLSKQLKNPETWLAADAWADLTPRSYQAATFALLLRTEGGQSNERPTIDGLSAAWPFSVGPLDFGQTLPASAGAQSDMTRCSVLTR